MKLLILGRCVTRDVIERLPTGHDIQPIDYFRMHAGGTLNRLRVNRVYWSETVDGNGAFPPSFPAAGIDRANRYLPRLYDVGDRTVSAPRPAPSPRRGTWATASP